MMMTADELIKFDDLHKLNPAIPKLFFCS